MRLYCKNDLLTNADTSSVPLTIKTSKNWVLPPRPKPGRKPTSEKAEANKDKKKKLKTCQRSIEMKSVPENKSFDTEIQQGTTTACSNKLHKQYPSIKAHSPNESLEMTKRLLGSEFSPKREIEDLNRDIVSVDRENNVLKHHLLSLINDYKNLKNAVLNRLQSSPLHLAFDGTMARKRSFAELVHDDPMNELISNLNDLSHFSESPGANDERSLMENLEMESKFDSLTPIDNSEEEAKEVKEVLNYINLDNDYDEVEVEDEEEDEDINSSILSRTTSPSALSETDCENSLMSSLTRSTTISTTNSNVPNDKRSSKLPPFDFYTLPEYSTTDYKFTFENIDSKESTMSIIQEDKYNMITDFLEEKLMDNNVSYYVHNECLRQ